jgi:bifunctional non-homologous end joining protein LigD
LPPGFVRLCVLIIVGAKPPSGPGWTHEVEQDGYRIIARRVGADVHVWSRNATDYVGTMTRIASALRKLRHH